MQDHLVPEENLKCLESALRDTDRFWWGGLMRMGDFICLPTQTLSDSNRLRFLGNFCLFQLFDLARLRELGEAAQRKALAWDELAYGRGLLGILCP